MPKTLADMTAEQRQQCRGMWVDTPWGLGIFIDTVDENGDDSPVVFCVERDDIASSRWVYSQVTPRPDLPRAWNPDGTPPEGEWVDGHMWWNEPGDDIQPVNLIGAECLGTGEMQGMDEWPKNVTPAVSDEDIQVRRFITEWEDMR